MAGMSFAMSRKPPWIGWKRSGQGPNPCPPINVLFSKPDICCRASKTFKSDRLLEMMLVNMKEGSIISAHDYRVARATATALRGGEVETRRLVDEEWLMTVERSLFIDFLKTPEPHARIRRMLDTGKPLRN